MSLTRGVRPVGVSWVSLSHYTVALGSSVAVQSSVHWGVSAWRLLTLVFGGDRDHRSGLSFTPPSFATLRVGPSPHLEQLRLRRGDHIQGRVLTARRSLPKYPLALEA